MPRAALGSTPRLSLAHGMSLPSVDLSFLGSKVTVVDTRPTHLEGLFQRIYEPQSLSSEAYMNLRH